MSPSSRNDKNENPVFESFLDSIFNDLGNIESENNLYMEEEADDDVQDNDSDNSDEENYGEELNEDNSDDEEFDQDNLDEDEKLIYESVFVENPYEEIFVEEKRF